MENKNNKKELKYVLSSELYDELRYIFRPDMLKNITYKPDILSENKWQCCCGAENELDVCTSCGMEKNTAFSKINANYLARHRRARLTKRKKAALEQQALMAAQMSKKSKKPTSPKKKNTNKIGTIIGVLVLCIAIITSIVIIFGNNGNKKPPIDTTGENTTNTSPVQTETSTQKNEQTTEDITTQNTPLMSDTTPPETTVQPPETTVPKDPVEFTIKNTTTNFSTIEDGKWAEGASGNVSLGGLVYSGENFDYIAKDGITVLEKNGIVNSVLTSNKAICITGNKNLIFYIDEQNIVHRIDTETKTDVVFGIRATKICSFNDELYYVPFESTGLNACDFNGNTTKYCFKADIYTINAIADKLYFSTDEGLAYITAGSECVVTFCPDGAKATSVIEITGCIFYTGTDGRLKFYNPDIAATFGVEYPIYNVAITHVSAYENRVYIRTEDVGSGMILWYSTVWTPGTRLFDPSAFTFTGIQGDALYVTNQAVFDKDLNRTALS